MKNLYHKILLPLLFFMAAFSSVKVSAQNSNCVVNKVRFVFRGDCCLDRLNGATIQGSNDRITWTTLYTISVNGNGGNWQEFTFPNVTPYGYVRYVASPNSYGELFEIEFYNNTQKLTGKAFGSSGTGGWGKFNNAIDGNIGTAWHGSTNGSSNYVGLQLPCGNITTSKTYSVDEVRIKFRNDCCFDRLLGAKIEASNDNITWTNLYSFTKPGKGVWEEFLFPNIKEYKYIRFVAGPTGYGELFGLEFYSKLNLLSGTGFGSAGSASASNVYTMAIDDNDYSLWYGAVTGKSNFVGIQLSIPNRGIGTAQSTASLAAGSAFAASEKNFVLTRTFKQKTTDAYSGNTQIASINIVYLDGLGRPIQGNGVQMNPGGRDIIRHVEYDNMGRISTGYLPFINVNDGANGTFITDPVTTQRNFYNSTNPDGNTIKDDKPWSNTAFETNPFGRSVEIKTAGKNYENFPTLIDYKFSKNGDVSQNTKTGIVDEADVQRYTYYGDYDPNNFSNLTKIRLSGKYGSNMMTVVEVTQQDKNASGGDVYRKVKQYRDFEGRNILTRTWSGTEWLETYYVYDDLNQVRAVLSPKLTKLYKTTAVNATIDFASTTSLPNTGVPLENIKELSHLYLYDELGRLIVKKETGIEHKLFVYDNYDRVVFTQDANQRRRGVGVWSFAKYDALNRTAVTGEATLSASEDASISIELRKRAAYQSAINSSTISRFVTRSNDDYNLTNSDVAGATYTPLSTIFYDDYTFTLPNSATAPSGAMPYARGFVTGTKVKVLGENNWLREANYYDNDYHVIKTFKDLYGLPASSGTFAVEVSTNNYNSAFHGQVASQETKHTNLANSATPIITKRFCYDHEERLKTIIYNVSNGPNDKEAKEIIGAAYVYNDLGQAVLKSMHQSATMKKPAFYVGYKFHLHGMLTEVNNRLFTQQISYDKRQDGSTGYLNGNVSELFHRFDDKTDTDWRGQNFTYDYLNRFTGNNNVLANNGTTRVWNNIETLTYDPNGNILGLTRSKEGVGVIDALNYIYRNGTNSNILATIGDGASPTLGFKARGNNAYSFDYNGNLLQDANKGINTDITYNYLDLPTQIVVPDANGTNQTLNYTYDATGQKLAMWVNNSTDRTLYTGEIEYNYQSLPTRIHTPMGYISRDADDLWQYTYNLKDYQGSVRVTAKYDPETKLAVTTQKTDFFVLGLPLRYDTENFNRYLYQDKEQQPYSEFFDFGWRQYDPLVGRWFNNDPADQFSSISPYAYVRNNPLMYVDPDGAFSFGWGHLKDLVNCTIPNFLVERFASNALLLAGGNAINQGGGPGPRISRPATSGSGRAYRTLLRGRTKSGNTSISPEPEEEVFDPSTYQFSGATELFMPEWKVKKIQRWLKKIPRLPIDIQNEKYTEKRYNDFLFENPDDKRQYLTYEEYSAAYDKEYELNDPIYGDKDANEPLIYVTYTKYNPTTNEIYSGRARGRGTPENIVAARDRGHHIDKDLGGFNAAVLDENQQATQPVEARWLDPSYQAIRGREQDWIDELGGKKPRGQKLTPIQTTSGNRINGVDPNSLMAPIYKAASKKFGKPNIQSAKK